MKKITSLLLTLILLMGMISVPSYAADSPKKIEDSFPSTTLNTQWISTKTSSNIKDVEIMTKEKDGDAANLAAKLSRVDGDKQVILNSGNTPTSIKERLIMDCKMAFEEGTGTFNLFNVYVYDENTENLVSELKALLTFTNDGTVSVFENSDTQKAITYGEWHDFRIDVDLKTATYCAWLDGEQFEKTNGTKVFNLSSHSAESATTGINAVKFDSSYVHNIQIKLPSWVLGTVWVDDILWRQAVTATDDGTYFEVESSSVKDGSVNVDVKPELNFTFSHIIKAGSAKYISFNNDESYIKDVEVNGNTLTLTLAKTLSYDTQYTLSFGHLEDVYGSLVSHDISFKTKSSYNMIVEDFDDGSYKDTKLCDATYYSGNEVKLTDAPDSSYAGNKAMYMAVNSGSSGLRTVPWSNGGDFAFPGDAVISFRLYIDEATTTGAMTLLDIWTADAQGVEVKNTAFLYFAKANNEIKVRTRGANVGESTYETVGTYQKNEWMDITLSFDMYNDSYNVAINGVPCDQTFTLVKTTNKAKTISCINFTCNCPPSFYYIDDINIAQRIFADRDFDYGFFNRHDNQTTTLDSKDTAYKASISNRGLTDENLILYIAGYDAAENTLEDLIVKELTVKVGELLSIEEHIENLKDDAENLIYKAFYVKDEESLEPYGSEMLLSRCIANPGTYDSDEDSYKHVVIVGVDGMGTFSNSTSTPNMDEIFAQGAYTDDMLVAIPTSSSHSWASCLTGVTPDLHALNDNALVETTTRDPESKFPTILRIVSKEIPGADVASIASWSGINVGIVETIDNDDSINGKIYKYRNGDANGTAEAVRYITEELSYDNKSLTYIHLNDPDAIGHANGYGTSAHLAEITDVDSQIGQIYDAIQAKGIMDDTLFIVTTDHGGTPKGSHGQLTDAEKFAVFGIKGKTVPSGSTIGDMEIRDTAAIVLTALGLDVPEYMSSRVPDGVFEGITAGERNVYYDPDNPRYHVPGATPVQSSADYVTNFVDEELVTYFPFDGNLNESLGNLMTTDGEIKYESGYFGSGVNLDNGSLILENYDTVKDSYTISTWIKTPCAYSRPIFTTKGWNGTTNCSSKGHVLAFTRDTTLDNPYNAMFNFNDGTNKMSFTTPLPEDYDRGWMHLLYIVDRKDGTISIAFDFGEPVTVSMESVDGVSMVASSMSTSYGGKLFIGNDYLKGFGDSAGLSLDEFMMFNGAFNRNDINDLAAYYGIETGISDIEEDKNLRAHKPTSTPSKDSAAYITNYITDNNLELYMPFDKSSANTAQALTVNEKGTVKYREGYFGNGLYLNAYADYLTVDDYKLGTDSFSSSFWLNVNSIPGATAPIFSTQDLASTGTKGQGISVYLSNANRLGVQIGDGSSYDRAYFDLPENYNDGWMHVTFVYDRTNKQFLVSFDFNEFQSYKITTTSLLTKTADGKEGCTFTIGQGGDGKYWTPLRATLDEFMIFDGVLDSSDLSALKSYYGK